MPATAPHAQTPVLTWAALATLVLLALSLFPACATSTGAGHARRELALSRPPAPGLEFEEGNPTGISSSSGSSQWSEPDDPVWDEARRAEAARALEMLWGVAGSTHALGAEWEFRFWSQGGAFTLLSLRSTEAGEESLAPIGRGAFLPHLSRELPTLLGTSPSEVTLELEREEAGWSVDLERRRSTSWSRCCCPSLKAWASARCPSRSRPSTIPAHLRRWFDKMYDPKDAAALARAEQSMMGEIAQLKARLSP